MPRQAVVPDPSRLDLLSLVAESTHITLIMRTRGNSARCPCVVDHLGACIRNTNARWPIFPGQGFLPASVCGRDGSLVIRRTASVASSQSD
jgi:hypothetical protein